MNKKLSKILTLITGVFGLIGIFFFLRVVMAGDDPIKSDVALQNSILSPFITYSLFLLILVGLVSVVFSLVNLFKNQEALKKTLIGVVIFAVLLVIAYSTASGDAVTNSLGNVIKDGEAGEVSKWVSALINFSFYLGVIGFVLFLYDFLKSLVKQ